MHLVLLSRSLNIRETREYPVVLQLLIGRANQAHFSIFNSSKTLSSSTMKRRARAVLFLAASLTTM